MRHTPSCFCQYFLLRIEYKNKNTVNYEKEELNTSTININSAEQSVEIKPTDLLLNY